MYSKIVIDGILINETATHYVTRVTNGIMTWSKEWYRKNNTPYNEE